MLLVLKIVLACLPIDCVCFVLSVGTMYKNHIREKGGKTRINTCNKLFFKLMTHTSRILLFFWGFCEWFLFCWLILYTLKNICLRWAKCVFGCQWFFVVFLWLIGGVVRWFIWIFCKMDNQTYNVYAENCMMRFIWMISRFVRHIVDVLLRFNASRNV